MALHTTTTHPHPRVLRLYRGEGLDRRPVILRDGIDGREPFMAADFPGVRQLRAKSLPHELVAELMIKEIREHVMKGSANSPFVSFSGDRTVAGRYSGGPHRGFVMGLDVRVAQEYAAEAFAEWQYGSFTDDRGRLWIWVDGCNVGADAITRPGLVKTFQALGARDTEYLLLGHVHPSELRF